MRPTPFSTCCPVGDDEKFAIYETIGARPKRWAGQRHREGAGKNVLPILMLVCQDRWDPAPELGQIEHLPQFAMMLGGRSGAYRHKP
jgi:hypothetical protein